MEIKQEHASLRKQLSIMKEELVIKTVKTLESNNLVSKEELNLILDSLLRIEFRFDINK